jgi:hypothetical protein
MTVDQVRSTHSWLQPKAPSSYPGAGLLNRGAFKNGVRFTGMPAWDMPDDQIWRLVALMRQLPKQFPPVKPAY